MLRWTIAGVIIVGLLVGIWLVWPRDGVDPGSTTLPLAVDTTTTESTTTTTMSPTTTTTLDPTQVREVETVEQAEAILRELWFGWFEGIYNQDEERIREVVATEEQVEEARSGFGSEFKGAPKLEDIGLTATDILHADPDCLSVWTTLMLSGFREGEAQNVHVLRFVDGHWRMLGLWRFRDDLWQSDCDVVLQP